MTACNEDPSNGTTITLKDKEEIYYHSVMTKFDLDQDGTLQKNELTNMLECHVDVPEEVVNCIFDRADENGDNQLNFSEFWKMIKDSKLSKLFGHYKFCYLNYVVPRKYVTYLQKYDRAYSCCPPPFVFALITVIQLVFFIVVKVEKNSDQSRPHIDEILQFHPTNRTQIWRYATYMFIHEGWPHLTYNIVVQLLFGITLELVHGWWRPLILYNLGVITSSLLVYVADQCTALSGASGGVYSLMTAHIGTIIMNYSDMEHACLHFIAIAILIIYDVLTSTLLSTKELTNETSLVAHLGGAIAGFLIGIWVLRNVDVTDKEKIIWWVALALTTVLLTILIVLNATVIYDCRES
ncbi:rhomboid-related protein 3-like [Rhynchophorus ferrugineus]|uniref:rhomboid-related protein 3-like n=1 Tax=Rhynchophorus ferrugineus TaxID=354439 RepID=UPI003FCC4980